MQPAVTILRDIVKETRHARRARPHRHARRRPSAAGASPGATTAAPELAANGDVAETPAADVAAALPLPDASADLILSRALLEHVHGVPAAIGHMARVLQPGGVALHLVPCRYSLFGMAARLLPFGRCCA